MLVLIHDISGKVKPLWVFFLQIYGLKRFNQTWPYKTCQWIYTENIHVSAHVLAPPRGEKWNYLIWWSKFEKNTRFNFFINELHTLIVVSNKAPKVYG